MVDNYIYFYHTDTWLIIPYYPDSIQDSMPANFSTTSVLTRSAPIFSYQNSGPRSVQVSFKLHRELMYQVNYQRSNVDLQKTSTNITDDYVDVLIKQLQAASVPKYSAAQKMVDPPIVAIRFGNDIFCKGVIPGGITLTYNLPILKNNKYASVDVSFNIQEMDPFGAEEIMQQGSFRGINRTLERRLWKTYDAQSGSIIYGKGSYI